MLRLLTKYKNTVVPAMKKRFGYKKDAVELNVERI